MGRMGGPGARRPGPGLLLLLALALLPREDRGAAAAEACAPGCSEHYLGDKNCDKECYTEACEWDRGDCETWELKRMFVMGPFYRDVQSVEYQAVNSAGQKRNVTLEEGMKWEGLLSEDTDEENNWMESLDGSP